jgi:hypothetical protein
MKLISMIGHEIDFEDGSVLKPSGFIAEVEFVDEEIKYKDVTLVKRKPVLHQEMIDQILSHIPLGGLGLVSFPVVSAARGTVLEGKVCSVIMKSRTEKLALKDRFSI